MDPLDQKPTEDRWDHIKARSDAIKSLAVAAGALMTAIGGVIAFTGLPGNLESRIGLGDSKKTELELEQKRAELRAAGARLEISYLFLDVDLLSPTSRKKPPTSKDAITLLTFPAIRNEILAEQNAKTVGCGRIGKHPQQSVAFLVIENRGMRDATQIDVRADQLRLVKPVRVHEAGAGGDDYVAKLIAAARSTVTVTVTVPRPLAPGEGVRVPLWVSATPIDRSNPWCVVSRMALRPISVRSVDPVLDSASTAEVRRLASPVIYANGIEGRG